MTTPNGASLTNARSLFAGAITSAASTPAAAAAAQAVVVPSMTAGIAAALGGTKIDDVQASDVILLGVSVDDSGSMGTDGKDQAARDGVGLVMDALASSRQSDGILVHIAAFNAKPICPFVLLSQAPRLTTSNYGANGGTPLLDRMAEMIAATLAKKAEFEGNGIPCRAIVLLCTDGQEMHSTTHHQPEDVRPLVEAALATETVIVSFMGIAEGRTAAEQKRSQDAYTDFAKRMGIADKWILTPGNDAHSIRDAWMMASRSMLRASVATGPNFNAGGFTSP